MDLTLTDSEAAFRDEVRSWLEENHPGPAPEGDDQAEFEFRRAWQKKMHEAGWAGLSWPEEYGGKGATLIEQSIFNEELARQRVPLPGQRARPGHGRSGGDRPRQRGAEGALPGADPLRRGDLVPGLLRARVRLRPRLAEDPRGEGATAAGRSPGRRSGPPTRTRRSTACSWPAPTRTPRSTRGSPTSSSTWSSRTSTCGRCARSRGRPSSTRSSSRRREIPDENIIGEVGGGWEVAITTLMFERAGLGAAAVMGLKRTMEDLLASSARRAWTRTQ